MPLNSETKKKVRKILAALKPLEKGELLAEQLSEDISENLNQVIQNFNSKIRKVKEELLSEVSNRLKDVPDLSEDLTALQLEVESRLDELEKEEIPNIQTQMQDIVSNDIEDRDFTQELEDKVNDIRREFNTKLGSFGGGNANRQINVNSSIMSNYYTDINFQQFGNVGWAVTNDHDLKRVNIRASILTSTPPAGANTQIQYNNNGSFGASSTLTWNPSTSVLSAGSVDISAITNGTGLAAGTWSASFTNVANLDSTPSGTTGTYLRVGNTVTASGVVTVNPTLTATSTQVGISLPVASNFANASECAGSAFSPAVAGQGAAIIGDAANNRAQMQWIASDINAQDMYFSFTYQVI